MAIVCPVDLDTARLRHEIQTIYARVAHDPSTEFHFHRGPAYAAERLGYDARALGALPVESTASFAGVANPLRMAPLSPGATVVDIGRTRVLFSINEFGVYRQGVLELKPTQGASR